MEWQFLRAPSSTWSSEECVKSTTGPNFDYNFGPAQDNLTLNRYWHVIPEQGLVIYFLGHMFHQPQSPQKRREGREKKKEVHKWKCEIIVRTATNFLPGKRLAPK